MNKRSQKENVTTGTEETRYRKTGRNMVAASRIKQYLAQNTNRSHALIMIVFDDFEELNLVRGIHTENRIDQQIYQKLSTLIAPDDVLIQEESRKFIVVHATGPDRPPEKLAQKIAHSFAEPCSMGDQLFYVFFSIAISLYPEDGTDPLFLIQMAEKTVRKLQKEERNSIRFARLEHDDALHEQKQRLMADLPAAIDREEITFVYQPQYSHQEKKFVGAELLARWHHPFYGNVSPALFIPLAEQSGMIGSLTLRSIITATKAHEKLAEKGIEDFSLSVNISPAYLSTSQFYETMEFLVDEYDLGRKKIHFEITEEALLRHSDTMTTLLKKIETLGIQIELDDFGTGYTSLKQLADLPVRILKIDKSFVQQADVDKKKRALLTAMMEMARALDIEVVTEGVERREEDEVIRSIGVAVVQGYYYARPVPLDAMIEQILRFQLKDNRANEGGH